MNNNEKINGFISTALAFSILASGCTAKENKNSTPAEKSGSLSATENIPDDELSENCTDDTDDILNNRTK